MEELSGKYNRLEIIRLAEKSECNRKSYLCRCDCGEEKIIRKDHIESGHTKSCGCLSPETAKEFHTKHGGVGTRLYSIWMNMKQRCNNENHNAYLYYGEKGIKLCTEWESDFSVFKDWSLKNGYDETLTIDRKKSNKGYSPDNCQWITFKENSLKAHLGKKYIKRNGGKSGK